jgi:hypothetical protein
VKEQFANAGICADFAIHDTGGGNPHAHFYLPNYSIIWFP